MTVHFRGRHVPAQVQLGSSLIGSNRPVGLLQGTFRPFVRVSSPDQARESGRQRSVQGLAEEQPASHPRGVYFGGL